jgi:hypothetical protein
MIRTRRAALAQSVKRFSDKIMRKQEERRLRLYPGRGKRKRRLAAPLQSRFAAAQLNSSTLPATASETPMNMTAGQ